MPSIRFRKVLLITFALLLNIAILILLTGSTDDNGSGCDCARTEVAISTRNATSITSTSATLHGVILGMSNTGSAYAYFVYGSDSTGESLMSSSISVFDTEIFPRGFSIDITNLVPDTRYWYIAGASVDSHDFGNEVEYFNTLPEEESGEQEEEEEEGPIGEQEEEEPAGEQEEEEEYYTLTVNSSEHGSVVNPSEGSHTYDEDTVVNLEAVADEGYQFDRWEGDIADPESASTTITMNADKSVTAYFEAIPPFELTSSAFIDGEQIPSIYSKDGATSPPLAWTGVPHGTVSFVLIMYDPGGWGEWCDHWIVFNIPADITSLEEGASSNLPDAASHGTVAGGRTTYYGCYPPEGQTVTYYFTIYALDTMLNLNHGATRQQVMSAMEGHILGEATLSGTYSR